MVFAIGVISLSPASRTRRVRAPVIRGGSARRSTPPPLYPRRPPTQRPASTPPRRTRKSPRCLLPASTHRPQPLKAGFGTRRIPRCVSLVSRRPRRNGRSPRRIPDDRGKLRHVAAIGFHHQVEGRVRQKLVQGRLAGV